MKQIIFLLVASFLIAGSGNAKDMNKGVPIPKDISTPDTLNTHLGEIKLFDGVTDKKSIEKLYYSLDLQRAVSVYLNGLQLSSMNAMRKGLLSVGKANNTVVITEEFLNAGSLF